jgi:hypothetical protein
MAKDNLVAQFVVDKKKGVGASGGVFFNVNGKECDPKDAVAKKLPVGENDNEFGYWVMYDRSGNLYDPALGSKDEQEKHNIGNKWKFGSSSKVRFDNYLKFLATRNPNLLVQARCEI